MFNRIKEYKFNRRMAKQRYKRGFADSDCWDLRYFFSNKMSKMILNLRDMKMRKSYNEIRRI